jgi:hypothetical protein
MKSAKEIRRALERWQADTYEAVEHGDIARMNEMMTRYVDLMADIAVARAEGLADAGQAAAIALDLLWPEDIDCEYDPEFSHHLSLVTKGHAHA